MNQEHIKRTAIVEVDYERVVKEGIPYDGKLIGKKVYCDSCERFVSDETALNSSQEGLCFRHGGENHCMKPWCVCPCPQCEPASQNESEECKCPCQYCDAISYHDTKDCHASFPTACPHGVTSGPCEQCLHPTPQWCCTTAERTTGQTHSSYHPTPQECCEPECIHEKNHHSCQESGCHQKPQEEMVMVWVYENVKGVGQRQIFDAWLPKEALLQKLTELKK